MDDTGGHAEAGRWLTYEDAARHFGVAPRTIERWIKDGRLRKGAPVGGRAVVWVADTPGGQEPAMADDIGGQERAVLLVDRISLAVSRQLEAVTAQLATVTERNEALARENGTLMEWVASADREMAVVRQLADADRQRARNLKLSATLSEPNCRCCVPKTPRSWPPQPSKLRNRLRSHVHVYKSPGGGGGWRRCTGDDPPGTVQRWTVRRGGRVRVPDLRKHMSATLLVSLPHSERFSHQRVYAGRVWGADAT